MPSGIEMALFERLIDHAPLFPPAQLPLPEALEEHRAAVSGGEGWIVRRFVCPASTLAELDGERLALSVVLDDDVDFDDPRIESVEVPVNSPFLRFTPFESYTEVTTTTVPLLAEAMARDGAQAKLRCGPTPPPVDELAAAMHACREHGLRFKATAGLHHAVRQNGRHGFLNLIAAAIFGDEEAALAEEDAHAFRLDGESFRWRGRAASIADVQRGRALFVAFGSCSFSEPVEDLRTLGFLAT
jgi:hypothetical protein